MKNLKCLFFLIPLFLFSNCNKEDDTTPPTPVTGNLSMTSELSLEFRLEDKYTCNGNNISPQISWSDSYTTTQSYVVIASNGLSGNERKIYWLLSDISNTVKKINDGQTPSGAVVGQNSFGTNAYSGPCPNPGSGEQEFVIQLFALDKKLNLDENATESEILAAMDGSVLKERDLRFFYSPFTISSDDFEHGGAIPEAHTCYGTHKLPHLKWESGKSGAVSYAIHMFDVSANNFIHLLVCDITVSEILNEIPSSAVLGMNDQNEAGYFGPCPGASSSSHLYYFRLYALNKKLNLSEGFSIAEFEQAIANSVIDRTDFYGEYPD